jgi:hypothetical protein
MVTLVVLETVLLVVLTVLVAGLLRAYATVLRRLHDLDGGTATPSSPTAFALDQVPPPAPRESWTEGHDLAGVTPGGEVASTRVVGVEHDTVLLFLSSGCASCQVFWDELARPVALPSNARLVVVAQGEEIESPAALAGLAAPHLDVLMSTQAWRDYEVPGSPHVVYVEGRTGRVRGEGTGQSWGQVAQLLARASGDVTLLDGRPRAAKPDRDAEVEAEVDRELLAAGILPGDPRLYS